MLYIYPCPRRDVWHCGALDEEDGRDKDESQHGVLVVVRETNEAFVELHVVAISEYRDTPSHCNPSHCS